MKTIILTLLISCAAFIEAPAQVHITPPPGTTCTTTATPCIVDTTVQTKTGKHRKKNLLVKENRDPNDSSSDLIGSGNRTLDRSDVNGGNDRDINRGQPLSK